MGAIVPFSTARDGGRPPLRLAAPYARMARIAWSGAAGSALAVPYDYATQEHVTSPEATPLTTTNYLGRPGIHRSASTTSAIHMSRAGDVFNSANVNVVFHALVYVDLCGTNVVNYSFRGAAETEGFTYGLGFAVNTSGIAAVRFDGGNAAYSPYLPKTQCEKRLLSIVVYEVGQTIGLIVDGNLIGETTHAYATRECYPAARMVMVNASGSEPTISVIQYASFFASDMSIGRLIALSADPMSLWEQPSRFVPAEAGGGEPGLTIADAEHGHTLEAVTLSTAVTLAIASMSHGHTLDAATLSADMTLTATGVEHGHTIENVTLDTSSALAVADMEHGHPVEAQTLTADMTLAAAGMEHGHTVESPTLSADMGLAVAGVGHDHTIDNVTLTGGGELWTPAELTTMLWLDAADSATLTLVGDKVSVWADKSGNGRDYSQDTDANRPGVGVINGVQALTLSGSQWLNNAVNPPTAGSPVAHALACVFDRPSAGTHTIPLGSSTSVHGYPYYWFSNNEQFVAFSGDGSTVNGIAAADSATGVSCVTAVGNGTARTLRRNGSAVSLTTGFAPLAAALDRMGRRNGGAEITTGSMGEIVLTPSALVTDDVEKLEGYLAHKWGTTDSLPGGHPYKTSPPTLEGATELTIAETSHAHPVDNVQLSAGLNLAVAEATHVLTVDGITLSADLNLAVADTAHAHTTDNVVLESSEPNLAVAGTEYAHTIDNVTLQAAMSLIVAGMEHPHMIDNITLSAALDLVVAGIEHPHTIDAVELVSGLALTVQDMTHAHTLAGLTLETALSLAINDALHGHTLDAVALEIAVTLLINDVMHAHTIDGPVIYLPTPVIEELRRSVFARVVQLRTFARLDNPQVFTRQ